MDPPPPPIEPPTSVQPTPPSTNGTVLMRHHLPPLIAAPYGKCNRNHVPGTGGLALDGCGEFMPSLTSLPSDPTFLNCAACGCHRETDHNYQPLHHVFEYQCAPHHPQTATTPNSPSPPPISSSYYPPPPHMFLALNRGLQPQPATRNWTKRFRSKFSEDQKAKMQEFAKRIGWKMQKKDEEMIMGFCEEIGVTKGVFKVWMHNHRKTSLRNSSSS